MLGRRQIAMIVAEFIGSATLVLAFYTIVARTSFPLFSALAAGTVLGMFTLIGSNLSGAHLNPAITFGLWTVRKAQTFKAAVFILAQMAGGFAAYNLIKYFLHPQDMQELANSEFAWKIVIAELIGAGIFAFGYAAAVFQRFDSGRRAAVVGGSLTMGILVASLASNAILNPAVALGIKSWSWAYAAAPMAGGLIGMNLYNLLFAGPSRAVPAEAETVTVASRSSVKEVSAAPAKKKTATRRKKTTTAKKK